MFTESAYSSYDNEEFLLNNTTIYQRGTKSGAINSCGHYKFISKDNYETYRPHGLHDCQLLYLAQGSATYYIQGKEHIANEGSVIIYYPLEPQRYIYRLQLEPEVYWIHFEYAPMKKLMKDLGIDGLHFIEIGTSHECTAFMKRIIRELQYKNPYYESLCDSIFQTMLILIARSKDSPKSTTKKNFDILMEKAIQYFHHKYNQPISISDFCNNYHTNEQNFRKNFKKYTGLSPKKFLLDIRMKKAMEFMQDSNLNFTEIASMVGYTDSLYFSRIFRQYTGKSPREYRNQIINQQ